MLRIKSAMATTQISTPPTSPSAMPTEEPAEVEIDDEEEEYEMADDSIAGTGIKPEDPLRQESLDEPMREVRTEERPAIASPPQSPTPPASVSPLPPVPPEPSRDSFVSFSQQRDLKADILSLFESALSDHPPQSALPTVGAATLAGFGKRESMAEDHVGNKFMLTSRTPSPQASFISNIVLANSPPPPAESTTLRDGTSLTPVDMARQPISDSTLLALHSSDPVEQLVDEGDVKTEVSVTVAALDIEQEGTFGRRGRGHSFLSPVGVTPHDYGRTSKHGGGKSSIVSWLMHKPKDTRKSFDDSKSTMSRTKSVRSNHSTKPEEDTSVISDEIVAATPAGSSGGESRSGLRPPVPEHFDMSASSPSRSSVGPNSSRKSFSADAISELMENDKVPHLPSVLIQKLKEFSGPIDRRALTSREPSSLLADLEVFFEDNGFVIQANGRERGEMFLRLVRKQPATPPRQQRAATALGTLPEIASPEPATPPRGTTPRRGAARGSSVPPPGRVPTTPGYTPSTPNARHYTSGSGSAAAFGHGPGASASSNRWRSGSTKSANKLAQAVMASLPVSFVRRLKRNNADHGGGGGGGSASTSGSSSASASSLFGLDSVENHDQQQLHNSAPQLHSQDPDAWVGPKAHSGDDGTTSIEDEDGAAAQHRASVVESLTRQPVPLPPPSSSHKKRNHHISFWNDKKRSPPSSTYGASSPPPPASHLAHHRTGAGFHQDTAAVAAAIAMTSATSVVEEEVKFNVEIEQIPNLPGLYVVHFKRIRGDVWEFKKLYHKVIREVLEKDKDA
ncbi:hypothetical protein DFJ73DRAFT_357945 [Zopfochytrium polystomum]|nr:hypothetical protein DFJ73DRAFT_357945 [Zopfochytrium polystomum]